jgi:hypothetical protein
MMATDEVSMEPVSERQEEDPTLTERDNEDYLTPSNKNQAEPTELIIQKQDSSEDLRMFRMALLRTPRPPKRIRM